MYVCWGSAQPETHILEAIINCLQGTVDTPKNVDEVGKKTGCSTEPGPCRWPPAAPAITLNSLIRELAQNQNRKLTRGWAHRLAGGVVNLVDIIITLSSTGKEPKMLSRADVPFFKLTRPEAGVGTCPSLETDSDMVPSGGQVPGRKRDPLGARGLLGRSLLRVHPRWVCWAVGLGLMSTFNENTGVDKQIGYAILIEVGVGNTLLP
ncbi:hypothetical protein TOPH_00604 [Tolypocladium ophioglossoides CBS 100239]|uniref:Uncharacterized protein n=1 Tax=Tolypocladium ophioglossoides (strain CBS 100239) TaxID=1163406 RepID=A0A0L0NKM8_TOLOC|nr:hypothetical protein TOPH_00604 [Tolypocladium ophioglossoides CBS 100239]